MIQILSLLCGAPTALAGIQCQQLLYPISARSPRTVDSPRPSRAATFSTIAYRGRTSPIIRANCDHRPLRSPARPAPFPAEALHRHHRPPRGAKFALGVVDRDGTLHGIALCCRPIARVLDDGLTLEVNRTATDGCPNANSALYGACWRVAAAMGYRRIITYTQAGETGASLTASGYVRVRDLPARGSWAASSVALKHLRDAVGTGSVERILWRRGDQLGLELTAPRRL